jgi:hypothetical protein
MPELLYGEFHLSDESLIKQLNKRGYYGCG